MHEGIALELGAAGATVYCAARSSRQTGFVSDDRPVAASVGELTVEQTAEDVTSKGGKGIAVPCDCSDEDAIEDLDKWRTFIKAESGVELTIEA